ncbi:MAG: DUF4139 domain-containing protein [Planctomycetaceae bacterium]|nr:DUF4139 domain-containing protein [Planctomycetaceae bacterium]
MRHPALPILLLLAAAPALAQDAGPGTAVTVYSTPAADPNQVQQVFNPRTGMWEQPIPGFSIVKVRRNLRLEAGINAVRFEDVAAGIDGSTVLFRSLTDPAGTKVLEQNFEYDLAGADRILDRYLGKEVSVVRNEAAYDGRLLSFDAGTLVLALRDETVILARDERIQRIALKGLAGGLVTKPTLAWSLQAAKAGEHLVETAYETGGMSWSADYTAVVSEDETRADLSAWVTIRNESGATYADAALKLVAGDVHRAPAPGAAGGQFGMLKAAVAMEMDGAAGFTEKPFFEYHLYTLGRRTTLPDRSLKQIELFPPVAGVACRKVYLYDGARGMQPWYGQGPNMEENFGETGNRKVGVFLEFENRESVGLGIPLPAGRMRVHKRDEADGFPELVGEDALDHTPKDEKVRLKMGDAFDVVGERKRTGFRADYDSKWMEESFEIRLRNHRKEAVEVLVAERLFRWVNAEIVRKSGEFLQKDAQTVHFPVKVGADQEATLSYTVRYTW